MEILALTLTMMLYPFLLDVIYDYLRYYEVWLNWFFKILIVCLLLSLVL